MTERNSPSFGKILVTGATGNVGSLLIPNLTSLGADVRALVRDESKAQGLKDAGVEVVVGEGHPACSYETFAGDFAQVFGGMVTQAV